MTRTSQLEQSTGMHCPGEGYVCGGHPSAAQLEAAVRGGVGRIINLCRSEEFDDYDEAALAQRLGAEYHHLPIAGAAGLTRENAQKLDALLAAPGAAVTLVHCGSGARVGALMALRAGWLQGRSTEAALAVGREWGLGKLEGKVSQLLAG